MPTIRLPAFAKVNLQLRVLGRRRDGYHELRTVFQTIRLHDTLELALTRGRAIELACSDPAIPSGGENLVWRAADAFRRETKFRAGVRIRLTKHIPSAAGLGGGSSNAAATLLGLLRLTRRRIPPARLMEIASGLGADVPFFLLGGRALGVGRGDEVYPLPDAPPLWLLVVAPRGIAVPTRDAYTWLDRRLTKRGSAPKLWRFCALCRDTQGAGLSNDFEAAVFPRYPRLAEIRRTMLHAGATEAALAGSGSAVFGVFRNPAQARRTARKFPDDRVFVCRTLSRQEYRRALGVLRENSL